MSRHAFLNEIAANERLIERIRARDEAAFDRLFRLCYVPLVDFAVRYVPSVHDAEELVTDLLVRVWEMGDGWQVQGPIMTYLFGAVRNRALNLRSSQEVSARRNARRDLYLVEPDNTGDTIDPEGQLDAAVLSVRARDVLERLSPRGREIFLLVRREGMSIREVAAILGIAPSTVQTHLARVLEEFRRALLADQ